MKRTLRLHLALLLVGLAPAGGATMAAPAAGAAPGVAPALIVVIIVDQLPAGTLERLGPLLSGGYRLLLDRGRRFTRCRHDHAVTETGPGHATLLSGLFPSHNGIILNHWHDTTAHADVYCIRDPEAGSRRSWPGAARRPVSPDNLEGENLADLLGRAARGAKVFTVAGKDRAAVLTAGHHPDGAFWFDVFTGGFTSSPGVVEGLPPWGAGFWGDGPVRTGLYKREIPMNGPTRSGPRRDRMTTLTRRRACPAWGRIRWRAWMPRRSIPTRSRSPGERRSRILPG
ncbi:MAG: alkaline phosphatase family protein, partial [Acidobacteriota bacterium]